MEGTQQLDAALRTTETRADANGQPELTDRNAPSLSDTQRALESFNAARDARSGVMRHQSHWILGR